MYYNKAIVIGNLTRNPEGKSLPSGMQVTTFSLATNRVYKDKNSVRQEATDYHNIVVFGKQADTCAQYLKKGQMALVEGRLQTRSWEDKEGKKNYRTEIVAERVQFGPKLGGSTGDFVKSDKEESSIDIPKEGTVEYPQEEINPEDIPF